MLLLDLQGERILLSQHVARELARRLDVDQAALTPGFGVEEIASIYLRQPANDPEDLYNGVLIWHGASRLLLNP